MVFPTAARVRLPLTAAELLRRRAQDHKVSKSASTSSLRARRRETTEPLSRNGLSFVYLWWR
jgi:hypothetical protein